MLICNSLLLLTCPVSPPPPLPHAVLAELQQAGLITSEDNNCLNDVSDVFAVQMNKSDEIIAKSAEVLKRHGFERESNRLAGKQTYNMV